MASATSQRALSTSAPLRKYDAFLSFRGEDTRKEFTDHLYAALEQKGIFVFRDDEELERGEFISEELLKAIQESEYAVVIISKNYAFSKWCLKELTEIVKCMRENQLRVLPVFYHVDPSDVRNPREGIFADAFAKYEEAFEADRELWSNALEEVGHIAGWHACNRYESTIIKEICGMILGGLSRRLLNNFKDVVGIEYQIKELMALLCVGANDVRFIGICGMGGIGKTTLANVIFESIRSEFEASCFVDDVREEVKRSGIVKVQRQVISKILEDKNKNIKIWNCNDGIRVLANRLQRKKVFIVLDNVNEETQMEALVKSRNWFGKGSRVLLTSRDKHLLERFVDKTHEANGLSYDDALRLFSLKAFKKHHPTNNYEDLSKKVVYHAGGLPLALKVFGSLLFQKEINVWESVIAQMKVEQDVEILDKLKISFDDLSNIQKELFLDIACFFNREKVNNVIRRLESLGRFPISNVGVLQDRSLTMISNGKFYMHDLLQEMGQQIVRGKPLTDPSRYSRLWCNEDIIRVLKNDTGTDMIEAISLKLPLSEPMRLSLASFSKMKRLKMLVIHPNTLSPYETSNAKASDDKIHEYLRTVTWHGDHLKFMLSNELQIMEWWGYPLECLPTSFEPDNLVELKMPMSKIKQLRNPEKNFKELKSIDLRDSQNLVNLPNRVPNLEELDVKGTGIKELPPFIDKLNVLRVGGSLSRPVTFPLRNLPLCLKSLRELNLSCCNLVDGALVGNLSCLSLLEVLDLSGNKFTRLGNVSQLSRLQRLKLKNCSRLKDLPPKFPRRLNVIDVTNCPRLTAFSDPGDIGTSNEMLVAGGISLAASYFGYDDIDGTIHVAQNDVDSYFSGTVIYASVAWGPTLTSSIPEWFNQKSTSTRDISGIFQNRFDFDVNVHYIGRSELDTTLYYGRVEYPDGTHESDYCWGYALFIVYEVFEVNSRQRKREIQEDNEYENSSSPIFPVFVCELQVNNEDDPEAPEDDRGTSPKVPIVFRVPEIPTVGRNGVWVCLNNSCFRRTRRARSVPSWYYIGSCSITISSPNVEVKECRGHLVLQHERSDCCEIIKSISPHDLDPKSLEMVFNKTGPFNVVGPSNSKGWIKMEEGEDEEGKTKELKPVEIGKRKNGLKSALFLICGSVFIFYTFVLKKRR